MIAIAKLVCYGVSCMIGTPQRKGTIMKVWLYYRLSRDEDEELNSLNNQRKIIYNFAVSNGHEVVGESFDDNVSGMQMDQLTAPLLRELIDHIEVYETQGVGKSRTQRITIHYRFVGYINIPAAPLTSHYISETRQGVAVEYIPA